LPQKPEAGVKSEEDIKLAMRLAAIEHMLAHLYRMFFAATKIPAAVACQSLDNFAKRVSGEVFGGLDPAMSDLASAEYEAASRRLIDAIKETVAAGNKQGSPPAPSA
jgi:hypothetical protein